MLTSKDVAKVTRLMEFLDLHFLGESRDILADVQFVDANGEEVGQITYNVDLDRYVLTRVPSL